MSSRDKEPTTPAVRLLRQHGIAYRPHLYTYLEKGGTAHVSCSLGVDEHAVIKTLIFEGATHVPMIVLMHGDCSVSAKELARQSGHKQTGPAEPLQAEKHSGYRVGGTSPFGTRKPMPIYVEQTILGLPVIYINGGHRGFILEMSPADLSRVLDMTPVSVAIPNG